MPAPKTRKKRRSISVEDEDGIWEFIHRSIFVNESREEVDLELWKDYINETGAVWSPKELDKYYNEMMTTALYKADLSPKKILELYKVLKISVPERVEHILEELAKAVCRFNRDRILVSFKFIEQQQQPQREEKENSARTAPLSAKKSISPQKPVEKPVTPAPTSTSSNKKVVQKNTKVELVTPPSSGGVKKKPSRIVNWELRTPPRQEKSTTVFKTPNAEPTSSKSRKAKKVVASPIRERSPSPAPASPVQEEVLDQNTSFDSDDDFKYDFKPLITRKLFAEEELIEMWRYIYNLIFDEKKGKATRKEILPKGLVFWREYVKKTGSKRTLPNLASHYRKTMMKKLDNMPIRKIQILRIYQILGIPVTSEKKKQIEENFQVKLRVENDLVVSWKFENQTDERSEEDKDLYDLSLPPKSGPVSGSPSKTIRTVQKRKGKPARSRGVALHFESDASSDPEVSPKRKKLSSRRNETLESTEPLSVENLEVQENDKDVAVEKVPERPERPRRRLDLNQTEASGWWGLESYDPADHDETLKRAERQFVRNEIVVKQEAEIEEIIIPEDVPTTYSNVPVEMEPLQLQQQQEEEVQEAPVEMDQQQEEEEAPPVAPVADVIRESVEIIEDSPIEDPPIQEIQDFQDTDVPVESVDVQAQLEDPPIASTCKPIVFRPSVTPDSVELISSSFGNFRNSLKDSLLTPNHHARIVDAIRNLVESKEITSSREIDQITEDLMNLSSEQLRSFREEQVDLLKPRAIGILRDGMKEIPKVYEQSFNEFVEKIVDRLKDCSWDEKSYLSMVKSYKTDVQNMIPINLA